jgi:signal transduction histidine kinase
VKQRTAGRLAWSLVGLFIALSAVGLWLTVAGRGWEGAVDDLVFVPVLSVFAVVGALIVSRRPGNTIGWLFLIPVVLGSLAFLTESYSTYALELRANLPGVAWMAWLSSWAWIFFFMPLLVFLPLLFPDGRLPSGGWRPFAILAGAIIVTASVTFALAPGPLEATGIDNPLGVPALRGWVDVLEKGQFLPVLLLFGSAWALVVRYRRAERAVRQQLKWFLYGVAFMAIWFALSTLLLPLGLPEAVDSVVGAIAFLSLPIGAGIGILRHRLFDIDVVVNRAVVFAILAGLITAVYVGIVVGIGAAVGSRGNLFLSILATALIAVGFQPVRERARRLADRLVFGKRATPYELLSEFAERLGGAYSVEDVLPRMARLVAEGTGAARARIWLRVGSRVRASASWPSGNDAGDSLPLTGEELPALPEEDATFPVRDRGELLGALSVVLRPGEELTQTQEKLLADLAAQAGLILRNVRLIEELRASRQRLVTAQDEERRRLERNIHDGAQQQLVALAVKLRLVETLTQKDSPKAAAMAGQAKAELQQALEDLRDLARGIYPPLLADRGLPAAVETQARKAPLPVTVGSDGLGRYPQEAEAAAYFCVLEALQNVAKYAEATRAEVRLGEERGHLTFTVIDDGRGFDPATTPRGSGLQNMADRVEALGGSFEIESSPGRGTTVSGRIPVTKGEAAR